MTAAIVKAYARLLSHPGLGRDRADLRIGVRSVAVAPSLIIITEAWQVVVVIRCDRDVRS
jgi:plasmid stabilization system protein ParE